MTELIKWIDFDNFILKDGTTYLIGYISADNPKKIATGIFYYKDETWYDDEYEQDYPYLSKDGIIQYIAKVPECKKNYDVELMQQEIIRLKNTIISLGKIIKEKKEMWDYFEARFIKLSTCTPEQKLKCLDYPDRCEGEKCMEWFDLEALLDKATDEGKIN